MCRGKTSAAGNQNRTSISGVAPDSVKPPAQSPGAVLVDGAGSTFAAGTGSAAYQPDDAILNVQENREKGRAFENETVKS